jgi:hypothetical protein
VWVLVWMFEVVGDVHACVVEVEEALLFLANEVGVVGGTGVWLFQVVDSSVVALCVACMLVVCSVVAS